MDETTGIDPTSIIEEFLFDVVEQLPNDADIVARSLQRFIPQLETLIYRLETQIEAQQRTLKRLHQQINYLKSITIKSSDLATKSTVIEGIITRLRSIMVSENDE